MSENDFEKLIQTCEEGLKKKTNLQNEVNAFLKNNVFKKVYFQFDNKMELLLYLKNNCLYLFPSESEIVLKKFICFYCYHKYIDLGFEFEKFDYDIFYKKMDCCDIEYVKKITNSIK